MPQEFVRVRFFPGRIQHVHHDDVTPLTEKLGQADIRRCTHVDRWCDLSESSRAAYLAARGADAPTDGWFADMTPCGGTVLGPFARRDAALTAELEALDELLKCSTYAVSAKSST